MNKLDLSKLAYTLLTQQEGRQIDIANRIGVTKADVFRLIKSKGSDSHGMSIEKVAAVLAALGKRVTFAVEDCPPEPAQLRHGAISHAERKAKGGHQFDQSIEDGMDVCNL